MATCVVLALAGCTTAAPQQAAPTSSTSGANLSPALEVGLEPGAIPAGWRTETFGRVQLGVPGDWGQGTTDQQWCKRSKKPFVGRPGALTAIGCASDDPAADTTLSTGGQFVWFGTGDYQQHWPSDREQLTSWVTTGDRVTFELAGERIAIQAPRALQQQILDTVQVVDNDENGCPSVAPFEGDQEWRPSGPAVTELGKVKSVSACKYGGAQLGSSVKLKGPKARRAIAAIAKAPEGGGPYTPAANCAQPEDLVAMSQIVLLVEGEKQGTIGLRWDGCRHRGLDDGTTVRKLTRQAVRPFVTGPNTVSAWTGGERMARILLP